MPSTFFGLEIGRRALAANQTVLDVIGHNTSNVNTPGYSRQVVNLAATDPYTPPDANHTTGPQQLGTGVQVGSITRVRDNFIDAAVSAAQSQTSSYEGLKTTLAQAEQIFNEPGTTGLGQMTTNFFNSFADLSTNPESAAVRSTVVNKAQTLVASFHSLGIGLAQMGPDLQAKVAANVATVNTLAKQIAGLNTQINAATANGDNANDLMDKRGALIDQMSTLVNVQTSAVHNPTTGALNGEVNVAVGGFSLVQGDTTTDLPGKTSIVNGQPVLVTADGMDIPVDGGQINGEITAYDKLQTYQKFLDTMANAVMSSVNSRHAMGYGLDGSTGQPFFTGANAQTIQVAAAIVANPNAIAAAAAPTPPATFASGNGDNARALAALTSTQVIGNSSINDYYNTQVAGIGADAKAASDQAANQGHVVTMLKNQQSAVSGVSLDEEMTHMLQFQRSYQAAARIVNTMDDVLDKIINGLTSGLSA